MADANFAFYCICVSDAKHDRRFRCGFFFLGKRRHFDAENAWDALLLERHDAARGKKRADRKNCPCAFPVSPASFPEIKNDKEVQSAISMNITANLFGIGNAATPLGIEAMKRLKKHAPASDTASNAMVLFVVLNTASIKLIPTTVAMLRHDAGSGAPMEILPVSLLVSFASCTAAIVVAKLLGRRSNG